MAKNFIIFGENNISFVDTDNREKYILFLSEGPTDGLDYTTIMAGAKYPVNITNFRKKIFLSLHVSWTNSSMLWIQFIVFGKFFKRFYSW